MSDFIITYTFVPAGRESQSFTLVLDADTFTLKSSGSSSSPPSWTELGFHQCSNCPLDPKQVLHCPVAVNIVDLVEFASDMLSYDQLQVFVDTPERTVSFNTTAQRGVSSLMGLYMAVSGCPRTSFFRPMARFHLPYSNEEETVYRVTSMYLLYQYYQNNHGLGADLDLQGLIDIYQNVQTVNIHLGQRLREAIEKDAALNAIAFLDCFTMEVPMKVEASLKDLKHYFDLIQSC
jgi:hypothetical protein